MNGDDKVTLEIASKAFCRVERFGMTTESEWSACSVLADSEASTFELLYLGTPVGALRVPLFGNHNIMNALAAIAAATHSGLPLEAITRAMPLFKRPKRRMEIVGTYPRNITLVEDFAHHPTAIRVTLEALGELYALSLIHI